MFEQDGGEGEGDEKAETGNAEFLAAGGACKTTFAGGACKTTFRLKRETLWLLQILSR